MILGHKQSMDIIIMIITIIIIIINNNGEGGVGLMTDLKRNEGIRISSTLEDGIAREMIRAWMEKDGKSILCCISGLLLSYSPWAREGKP